MAAFEVEVPDKVLQFRDDGYTVLNDIFDPEVIRSLRVAAERNFDELSQEITSKNLELGIGIKNGFKEIVQRHKDRFEMPYKMDTSEFAVVSSCQYLETVISSILGDDNCIVNRSLVLSLPGAEVG